MFKREMKYNLKSFLIWTSLIIAIYLVVYLIYPTIISSENVKLLNEMLAVFPQEILKAFNMDISSIDSAYGWLKSEGFVFILLITGSYATILGSQIVLKEESEKTIEYLNSLPVKRQNIMMSKFIVGIIYITCMVIIIGIFNYIGLTLSGDFNQKQYIYLSLSPLFPAYILYSLSMFISTFFHKTKKMLGISLGIVFMSYILQMLSELTESVEFLKYFSVFTLADIRHIITEININPIMIIISVVCTLLFLILSIIQYERKDLI